MADINWWSKKRRRDRMGPCRHPAECDRMCDEHSGKADRLASRAVQKRAAEQDILPEEFAPLEAVGEKWRDCPGGCGRRIDRQWPGPCRACKPQNRDIVGGK